MAKFTVCGEAVYYITVTVEAETIEEAIDLVDSDIYTETYANETVGVEYCDDAIEEIEVDADSYIKWQPLS